MRTGLEQMPISIHAFHPPTTTSSLLGRNEHQNFKAGVKKSTGTVHTRIARYLFHNRISPQSTTRVSPAELLMGHRLHSTLDLLKLDLSKGELHINKPNNNSHMTSKQVIKNLRKERKCMHRILVLVKNGYQLKL